VEMKNQKNDLPDRVVKTSCRWNYTPDPDSYLPNRESLIKSHTKYSQVPVSHDGFPLLLLIFLCLYHHLRKRS
jgi:hypothetical protein